MAKHDAHVLNGLKVSSENVKGKTRALKDAVDNGMHVGAPVQKALHDLIGAVDAHHSALETKLAEAKNAPVEPAPVEPAEEPVGPDGTAE